MRKPDIVIGENYLERWYIIPRNKFFNIYLHKFSSSDDDRAFHDHPWASASSLLKGKMVEHFKGGKREIVSSFPIFRRAVYAHRLEIQTTPVWTLFITGPVSRKWGFLCPKGWLPWEEFTDSSGTKVGKGCE